MRYSRTLAADQLESAYGFVLQQAIPVDRKGDVPRIAVFQELNPFAPEQIFCSAVVRDGAETLVRSGRPTRVFVRLEPNRWADCGMWKAVSLHTTPANAKKASDITGRTDRANHGPIWGILHMEEVPEA